MPPRSSCPDDEHKVCVAEILKAHGLAGEVAVELYTDFPKRLAEAVSVEVSGSGQTRNLRVESIRPTTGTRGLLKFLGVDSRDDAEKLRGCLVLVDKESVPAPPEGAYYDFQIVGLRVVTTSGRDIGRVLEVIRTGANDVYATGDALIPAVDNVISRIDLERGQIIIEEVEGLLD